MRSMRAKMVINSIKKYPEDAEVPSTETLQFNCVSKKEGYPEDGSDENNTFAKFSPCGSLSLTVANPDLIGKFAVGEEYYLDFIKAE